MAKKQVKKHSKTKDAETKKSVFSEKRQRHYAFGFLVGEY